MRFTTRSRYASRLMLDIALNGDERPVPVSDIARRQGVSVKYLEKLIRELKAAGLLRSRRGPHGGHMLSRPASQITIGEIVAVLETGPELVDCQRSPEICPRSKTCITRNVWEQASEAMYNVLYGITLDQLASSARECPEGGTHRTDLNATAAI